MWFFGYGNQHLCILPIFLGVACSSILSVTLEEVGCEPVLNFAATPDEAVSIICTVRWQNYTFNFLGEVDVCELYNWLASVSVRHLAGALAITCHWVLLIWLIYTYGMLCQDDIAPGEFLLLLCECHFLFFWLGTSTHVCSWSIADRYIIKRHGSQSWYGCWTIKALVEAEVLYDEFTVSRGCIAAPLIIARPLGVSLLISNYKTSIKPI